MTLKDIASRLLAALGVLALMSALFAAVLSCSLTSPSFALASQDESARSQTVKVGYYESRAFQEGASDGAVKDGFGYEYLQRVASYAGWRYEYVYGTWNDLYSELESGQIDLLAGVAKTSGKASEVLFPNASMLNETFYLYEDNDSEDEVSASDPSNVDGKRIGVIAGSNAVDTLKRWVADNDIDPKIVFFEDKSVLCRALRQGKIDAFVSSDNVTYDIDDIAPIQIVGKEPYYLAVSPDRYDLLADLNDAQTIISTQDRLFIDKLSAKYTVDTAANKYLTRSEAKWMNEHDTLTVGYVNNYLPYCDTDSNGNPTGLMLDVLEEILDRLPGEWNPTLAYVDFDDQHDLFDALKNGEVDIAFPVGGETWYSEQKGYLRSSPVTSPTVDLIYQGSNNYADATGCIAVNTNNVLQENYVRLHYPDALLVYCNSIEECLKAVKSGSAGSTVVNGLRAGSLLNNESNLVALQLPENDDRCFGVNPEESVLLQILNRGLGIIGSDFGTNASYLYMDGLYSYTPSDFFDDYWPFVLAVVFGLALALVAWGVRYLNKLQYEKERDAQQKATLEKALETAERASAAKDTLLNNLSHDIRTPLNGILGVIDVNMTVDDPAARKANAKKAHRAADQLLAVIDELLEMSKLKSGEVEVVLDAVCLGDVVNVCIEETSDLARAKHVDVRLLEDGIPLERCLVMTSSTYLRQVLINVIDNAIRYNNDRGEVVISASAEKDGSNAVDVHITVSDNGPGMSDEHSARVFEPFFQGHGGARSVYPGSGLGMSIVKEIVKLLGGSIELESKEGVGTIVTLAFSFTLAQDEEFVDNATAAASKGITGLTILLVEDNELNVEITRYALEQNGAFVEVARDGLEAVNRFALYPAGHFDAIVMDIMMPNMDGIESTKAIRAMNRDDANTVPVVAMTANVLEGDRASVLDAGMNAYLRKPLNVDELVETLSRLCG